MKQNNIHYFNYSADNNEDLDTHYMFLDWNKNLDSYIQLNNKIKELITAIKVLEGRGKNATYLYKDLYNIFFSKFSTTSEFNCFINACDNSESTLKGNFDNFKKIVKLYLQHRTITNLTPKEWVQAILDKRASASKGSKGEDKLISIAKEYNFTLVNDWKDFKNTKKAIVKFSKNKFDLKAIKENLNIELNFNSQNKMMDIIIKKDDKLFFIEAKHINTGGGSQNHSIGELISIINHNPSQKNVYYIAFLDGLYSNLLLNYKGKQGKIVSQKKDILDALNKNSNTFWLNTAGFKKLLKDIA